MKERKKNSLKVFYRVFKLDCPRVVDIGGNVRTFFVGHDSLDFLQRTLADKTLLNKGSGGRE